MGKTVGDATLKLRQFMFERVYNNSTVKSEDDKILHLISSLFSYYKKNIDKIPKENLKVYNNIEHTKEDIICDYIAGMTDIYVINLYKSIYIPKGWSK